LYPNVPQDQWQGKRFIFVTFFFRLGPVTGRDYGKHIFSEILSHPFIMAV